MKPSTALFLACLSLTAQAAGDEDDADVPRLRSLDLERIVIHGRARNSPAQLQELQPTPAGTGRLRREPEEDDGSGGRYRTENTLKALAGSYQAWDVSDALNINNPAMSLGARLRLSGSSGFREGYGRDETDNGIEWSRRNDNGQAFTLSAGVLDRKMDLPEPEGQAFRQQRRRESAVSPDFKFESPLFETGMFSLFVENQFTTQEDTGRSDFNTSLSRVGCLYKDHGWETAFTIESDKRDLSRSLLTRFFVKKSHAVNRKRTTLHLGMGVYSFSNDNEKLRTPGPLSLIEEQEERTGVSLSPYIQVDQVLSRRATAYVSYAQTYENSPYADTYFNMPELSRPDDFIQPALNIHIETGLRADLHRNLRGSLSYALVKHRNKPVLIEDVNSSNHKLTTEIFDKGHDNILTLELESKLGQGNTCRFSEQLLESEWDDPHLGYTPYKSRHTSRLSLEHERKQWLFSLVGSAYDKRQTYPGTQTLPSGHQVDFMTRCHFHSRFMAHFDLYNISNRGNIVTFGYPQAGIHFMAGMSLLF